MNELDISFFLQLSQIQNLEAIDKEEDRAFKLPKDLMQSILFTKNEIRRLIDRDQELKHETRMVETL